MIIEHIITGQRFEVADGTNFPTTAYRVVRPEPAKPETPDIVANPEPTPETPDEADRVPYLEILDKPKPKAPAKKPAAKKKTAKKKTKKSKK